LKREGRFSGFEAEPQKLNSFAYLIAAWASIRESAAAVVHRKSTTKAVITIAIQLRQDYDVSRAPASIRREQKINMSIFRRSRVVVVSQSNRNCDIGLIRTELIFSRYNDQCRLRSNLFI